MGACRDFSGTAQYVDFGTTDLVSGETELTLMCWINPDSLSTNQGFTGKWLSTSKPFYFGLEGSKLFLGIGPGDDSSTRNYITSANLSTHTSTGEWAHIAVNNSLTTTVGNIITVNGSVVASQIGFDNATDTSILTDASPYFNGALSSSIWLYNGRMCFSSLYTSRLTQPQINELQYNPFSFISLSTTPLWNSGSTETEIGNGLTGTVTGATENFDGPPVFLLGGQ